MEQGTRSPHRGSTWLQGSRQRQQQQQTQSVQQGQSGQPMMSPVMNPQQPQLQQQHNMIQHPGGVGSQNVGMGNQHGLPHPQMQHTNPQQMINAQNQQHWMRQQQQQMFMRQQQGPPQQSLGNNGAQPQGEEFSTTIARRFSFGYRFVITCKMQEEFETRIRENMTDLVDLTSNVEEIAKILRGKNILSEKEKEEIISAESSMDKKSKLFWLMSKKDASTCDDLLDALKATGNNYVADKFSAVSIAENGVNHVTVETSNVTPDAEGMALAVEIEKEFERMQTKDDACADENVEDSTEEQTHKEHEVTENHVEEDENDNESDVRVEITAPTESEPEPSETEQDKEQEVASNDLEPQQFCTNPPSVSLNSGNPNNIAIIATNNYNSKSSNT